MTADAPAADDLPTYEQLMHPTLQAVENLGGGGRPPVKISYERFLPIYRRNICLRHSGLILDYPENPR